jgi:hypothetical protein
LVRRSAPEFSVKRVVTKFSTKQSLLRKLTNY